MARKNLRHYNAKADKECSNGLFSIALTNEIISFATF
jgi:hypothetical protein